MNIEERNKLIEYIYSLGLVQNYIKKIGNGSDLEIYDDVCGEICTQILEVPLDRWDSLLEQGTETDKYKAVRAFIVGIVYRNIRSENSKLYRLLKKYKSFEYLQDEIHWDNLKNSVHDEIIDYLIMEIGDNAEKVR